MEPAFTTHDNLFGLHSSLFARKFYATKINSNFYDAFENDSNDSQMRFDTGVPGLSALANATRCDYRARNKKMVMNSTTLALSCTNKNMHCVNSRI